MSVSPVMTGLTKGGIQRRQTPAITLEISKITSHDKYTWTTKKTTAIKIADRTKSMCFVVQMSSKTIDFTAVMQTRVIDFHTRTKSDCLLTKTTSRTSPKHKSGMKPGASSRIAT